MIYITINKLATLVAVDSKAPVSIATTLSCREGYNFFLKIGVLTLDPYLIILSVYHFLSLWNESTWYWTPVSWTIGEH